MVAALVLGAGTQDEVVKVSGLSPRDAARALDRLTRGGLVVADGGVARFASEGLRAAARRAHEAKAADEPDEPDASGTRADPVLRSFVRHGRLVSIPTARGKRLVVLKWLATRFEPGRTYPEPETNRLLNEVHPDHAALRRYLVDEGLLERRDGFYWRSGGAFDVE